MRIVAAKRKIASMKTARMKSDSSQLLKVYEKSKAEIAPLISIEIVAEIFKELVPIMSFLWFTSYCCCMMPTSQY